MTHDHGQPLNAPAELHQPAPSVARRLLDKVGTDPNGTGCWLWTGHTDGKGYGQLKLNGRRGRAYWAHRMSYACFRGPIPAGMTIEHMCRVPSCVNPLHLELATVSENTANGNRDRARPDEEVQAVPF
jgi:hypothetical protein